MKTYVLTVSKNFLKDHPRAVQPTNFKQSILNKTKIHTIRGNSEYWVDILEKVIKGDALLSIREWEGAPYKSKQIEIKQLTAKDGVGYQEVFLSYSYKVECSIDDDYHYLHNKKESVYLNDGLTYEDFRDWFFPPNHKKDTFHGIIIHFTDFRY